MRDTLIRASRYMYLVPEACTVLVVVIALHYLLQIDPVIFAGWTEAEQIESTKAAVMCMGYAAILGCLVPLYRATWGPPEHEPLALRVFDFVWILYELYLLAHILELLGAVSEPFFPAWRAVAIGMLLCLGPILVGVPFRIAARLWANRKGLAQAETASAPA